MNKQQCADLIRPILEKGNIINDIIFMSKKMTPLDIYFMLSLCRVTKEDFKNKKTRLISFTFKKDMDWGWTEKDLYDFVDNPMWGGDYYQQLLFGVVAALDVYTEQEIIEVVEAQKEYREAK